jgi:hypothetical protein
VIKERLSQNAIGELREITDLGEGQRGCGRRRQQHRDRHVPWLHGGCSRRERPERLLLGR